jgi:hypothetical protein
MFLSKMIWALQIVAIANVLGGESIRRFFTFIPRNWFDYVDEKKWIAAVVIFMSGNLFQSMCSSTGAFEVFINNQLVLFIDLRSGLNCK